MNVGDRCSSVSGAGAFRRSALDHRLGRRGRLVCGVGEVEARAGAAAPAAAVLVKVNEAAARAGGRGGDAIGTGRVVGGGLDRGHAVGPDRGRGAESLAEAPLDGAANVDHAAGDRLQRNPWP